MVKKIQEESIQALHRIVSPQGKRKCSAHMKDQRPEEADSRNTNFVWPLVIQSNLST